MHNSKKPPLSERPLQVLKKTYIRTLVHIDIEGAVDADPRGLKSQVPQWNGVQDRERKNKKEEGTRGSKSERQVHELQPWRTNNFEKKVHERLTKFTITSLRAERIHKGFQSFAK